MSLRSQSSLPGTFPTTKYFTDIVSECEFYLALQTKMIENGWKLMQEFDDDGELVEYFQHPNYGEMRVPIYKYVFPECLEPHTLKFPFLSPENDPIGLGCYVALGLTESKIVTNEWISYWSTRRGRKKQKYRNKKKFLNTMDDGTTIKPLEHRHTY